MKRIAVIDKERCRSTECGFRCYKMCPVAMNGKEIITLDSQKKAEIEEVLCTGCGVCPKICPYNAIRIINLPDILNKVAIHQYGPNGFRIFDLPVIEEKTIIGILGKNGTGKSTIIKVLSERIHANFEEYGLDAEESHKHLLERYKGSTLHKHFTSLFEKKLQIAYKPQHILGLKQLHKDTPAKTLLLHVNNDEEHVHKIATVLHIDHILERPMGVLSGGELQRVALCATLLKDASLYVFDEISNFLDIYERISSAKVMKEMLEGKSSIIIEHDLIVLDYIADTLHLIFGEVGAYGYLSKKKSTRIGINQFLDGMAAEENIRFRDKPIIFDKEGFTVKRFVTKKLTWVDEQVKRGEFVVDVQKGALYDGEVMGIIGKKCFG